MAVTRVLKIMQILATPGSYICHTHYTATPPFYNDYDDLDNKNMMIITFDYNDHNDKKI